MMIDELKADSGSVQPLLLQYFCYMPQLDTLNYLSNVDNLFIDYGTLIKILSIFV